MNIPNLVQRLLLAVIAIPVLYLCLRQGGILSLIAVDIIIFFALLEFIGLLRGKGFRPNWVLTVFGALALSWDVQFARGGDIPLVLLGTLILALLSGLARRDRSNFLVDAWLALFGVLFIGFCVSCVLLIRQLPAGADFAVLVFLLIWICDTAAYFVGASLGRRKLWPQVSPKKTVEGTAAGLLGAWAAAFAAKLIFLPGLSTLDCIALGAIAGVLGQAGDLAESAFKRWMGVKDSSHILPGHGGFLDRFDSLLFTAPSIYYYVKLVAHH
ncbi:MAG: phosphatidate cytidylyltransferase [bacterium]